jgi:oligopeptidase B
MMKQKETLMSKETRGPRALQTTEEFHEHEQVRKDPYRWLRDVKDPNVVAHLAAENKYTEEVTAPAAGLQKKLFQEMKARLKESDTTAPALRKPYWYYSRTEEGKPYRIYCRKKNLPNAKEEILIDGNLAAGKHSFFQLGAFDVSPDQQRLAYSIDVTGAEIFEVFVKNLQTGQIHSQNIRDASYGIEWSNDNETLYYITRDKAQRPYRVFRHMTGSSGEDVLLYEEKDEAFHLGLGKTLDRKFIEIVAESGTTSDVRLIDADDPKIPPELFAARKSGVEMSVDHSGEFFYVRTNEDAKNFKIMRVPEKNRAVEKWVEFIPHRQSRALNDMTAFKNWLVISKREDGLKKLMIVDLRTMGMHDVVFPEPTYDVMESTNLEFDTNFFRFQYNSLITPRTIFDYDMETRNLIEKKVEEVLGDYHPSNYVTERLLAKAEDGTEIPISVVYKKGLSKSGDNPCLLDGYGAYGISNDADFSSKRVSLLDRGFIYAIAHIRGGGEMGEEWHDDGKMHKKKNSFTDFIAAAEFLIGQKWTSPKKLIAIGGSAGGLLMGAVTNMRPDLFRAVVAKVPFVDLLNTMSDPSLPLTVGEYEEWGNPSVKEDYDYMRSYSPYDNVEEKAYPHVLAIASLYDTRVSYWEAAKWVQKLRSANTSKSEILLKINMEAGHGGAADRYKGIEESAFEFAFMLNILGIEK